MALPRLQWRDPAFWATALRLALPVAVQNLLISSFALVDTLMVGQLGDVPLSAIGMATQWAWFLNICQFGFCSGATLFYAQYWGVRDVKGIHRVYGTAMTAVMLLSAIFSPNHPPAPAGLLPLMKPRFSLPPQVPPAATSAFRSTAYASCCCYLDR